MGHAQSSDAWRTLELQGIEPLPNIQVRGRGREDPYTGPKELPKSHYLVTGRLEKDPKRALLLRFPRARFEANPSRLTSRQQKTQRWIIQAASIKTQMVSIGYRYPQATRAGRRLSTGSASTKREPLSEMKRQRGDSRRRSHRRRSVLGLGRVAGGKLGYENDLLDQQEPATSRRSLVRDQFVVARSKLAARGSGLEIRSKATTPPRQWDRQVARRRPRSTSSAVSRLD